MKNELLLAAVLGALAALPPVAATAQETADCLACHGDKGMTAERKGRTVSLYVAEKPFTASVHGSLTCASCHADLQGKELPHDVPLAKVDCGSCHEVEQKLHAASLHGKAIRRGDPLAPRCASCHGTHDIRPVKDPASPVSPLKLPFTAASATRRAARSPSSARSTRTTSSRTTPRASTARPSSRRA